MSNLQNCEIMDVVITPVVICYGSNKTLIQILVPGSEVLQQQIPKTVGKAVKLGSGQRQKTFEAHHIEKVGSGEDS